MAESGPTSRDARATQAVDVRRGGLTYWEFGGMLITDN